jgi:hypothetical protein
MVDAINGIDHTRGWARRDMKRWLVFGCGVIAAVLLVRLVTGDGSTSSMVEQIVLAILFEVAAAFARHYQSSAADGEGDVSPDEDVDPDDEKEISADVGSKKGVRRRVIIVIIEDSDSQGS